MPKYALLGATGATGSSILRCLLSEPPKDLKLNILVRSKNKLLKSFPKLEEASAFAVNIIEGTSTNTNALRQCLSNADVILMCVASNESTPRASLAYDSAAAIIDSLKTLQTSKGSSYKTPTLLQLRAAPENPIFRAQMPAIAVWMLWFCLYFAYTDGVRATELYDRAMKETPGLLDIIRVDPPGLHDAYGTERTGHTIVVTEEMAPNLSYADLGAGFCEVAERREEFRGKAVGVNAIGKVKLTPSANIGFLARGAVNRIYAFIGWI